MLQGFHEGALLRTRGGALPLGAGYTQVRHLGQDVSSQASHSIYTNIYECVRACVCVRAGIQASKRIRTNRYKRVKEIRTNRYKRVKEFVQNTRMCVCLCVGV